MTTSNNTPEFNEQVLSKLCDMVLWLDQWEENKIDPTLIASGIRMLEDSRTLLLKNNVDYKKY
jgi:hypothetical protein